MKRLSIAVYLLVAASALAAAAVQPEHQSIDSSTVVAAQVLFGDEAGD